MRLVGPRLGKLVRGLALRASSHFAGDQEVRRLLENPATRKSAFSDALNKVAGDPLLAIDILSCGVFSLDNKVKVLNKIVTSDDFGRTAGTFNNVESLPQPPRFFSVLALRPNEIVNGVSSFWQYFDRTAGGIIVASTVSPNSHARMEVPANRKLAVLVTFGYKTRTEPLTHIIPNSHEIDGYKIGRQDFYLLKSGPVKPYPWSVDDAVGAFGLSSYPLLRKNLVEVRSEGFYFPKEIRDCVRMAAKDFNAKPLQKALSQGPCVISVRRHSFSSLIEVILISANTERPRAKWAF